MSGIFIPTLRASPFPRVSLCLLLSTWLRRAYMARSLAHEAQIPDQQHSSKAWRFGNWQAHAGFLVFRESGARAIRSPRPCLCLVRLVAEIFDICFVVCRYAGSPCPRIARASRIATIKSWEFFPTISRFKDNELSPYRLIPPLVHP